ncbi:hypothetical protein V3C99_002052 [Haemonchus contortus]
MQIRKHDWKPDIVYLYQFPRAETLPNLSPYCLKVETFLKANKIPYEVCSLLLGRSAYGLLPFIELNGEHIADSQIILHRLKTHFKVKPLPSPKDEALARTIERTTENHTAPVIFKFKIVESSGNDYVMEMIPSLGLPQAFTPILAPLALVTSLTKTSNSCYARTWTLTEISSPARNSSSVTKLPRLTARYSHN